MPLCLPPLSRSSSVALVAFLLLLRCAERLLSPSEPRAASAEFLAPTGASPLPLRTPPSEPLSEALHASQRPSEALDARQLHQRPLSAANAAIWRPQIGRWLASHVGRRREQRVPPTLRGCAGGCGAAGSCNEALGECRCRSGSRGSRCQLAERWECNAADGRYMWSRCAGECDTRHGYCYCGARGTYPERQLVQCEPIGIENVVSPWRLDPRNAVERAPWSAIWGKRSSSSAAGWCDANASVGEVPPFKCSCRYDGIDGYLCQHVTAMYCLNQCNFRGRCEHGFCLCEHGWWGADCSIASTASASTASAAAPPAARASAGHVPTDEASAPAEASSARVRPLVYVYEMPGSITTDLLQRRHDKMFCVHRTYLKGNRTQYAYGIYQGYVLEVLLHEWLLASPHRTTDPSEADWFYVPVYASCAMVTAIFETPERSPMPKFRTALASKLYLDAYEHVRTRYPYWNASSGRDHIWTFGYDEGACFAPAPLWPSLIISHWGNTMSKHNRCTTTYEADRWDVDADPYTHLPLASLIGRHPCYDPEKDLVLPSFRELTTFLPDEPGAKQPPRRCLLFFSGDLGSPKGSSNAGPHVSPAYSMGIRQAVYRAVQASASRDIEVIGHLPEDYWHLKYHAKLRNATFCGAFPGDGWSGGISSAIFAGCVPVIISDGIHLPFENVLDYSAFSVRIPEADIPHIAALLRAIPPERVRQLQAGLAVARSRFSYSSLAPAELRMAARLAPGSSHPEATYLPKLAAASKVSEDALQTVMRVLLYRAAKRRGEA